MPEFVLTDTHYIKNIGKINIYSHKSGARVISVDSSDTNLVFSLSFDTPAFDDTGIPHILEHCVLCGSEAYPTKDPFNFLEKNTVHSYLNAITYPHKTLYPVASTDENSLMLMAKVYCDSVFHPLVYNNKGIFLQEGGFFDGKRIRGSVYGEMSGFYDISDNNEEQRLKKAFTPFLSAGVPEDIPNASYPALIGYHKRFYTPANCTAYIYGNCNKQKYFDLLSEVFDNAKNGESPVISKTEVPKKIFANKKNTVALVPICKTSDYYAVHNGGVLCSVLQNHGINAAFNTDGEIAYIKIKAENVTEIFDKYRGKIRTFDLTKPYFYLKNADFGYKPKGIYYNILMMQSGFDPKCLDFENIYSDIWDDKLYLKFSDDIFSRDIEYIDTAAKETQAYPLTDPAPLYAYQVQSDSEPDITLPLPKIPRENITVADKTAFTDDKNKDIINLTLAFVLDLPDDMPNYAVSLLKMRHSSLPLDTREFGDIGKPVFMIHLGFFAENSEDFTANEINKIFDSDAPLPFPPFSPEILSETSALGSVEESGYILDLIYNGIETDNISDIQKTLFTKNNLYCAVSTDKSNFKKAEKIISRLKLYPDIYRKKTVFRPEISDKIIQTDNSVNNISLAFKSSSNCAEKYALALFLQNTYLWENIRCKGAYGCNCGVTPNGNIFMTSFKDIDFESSIKTMKDAFSYIQNYVFSPNDIYRLKLMCLNALLRPKTPKDANIYALKKLCGAKDITDGILSLTLQSLVSAAKNTQFIAFSAYKAKI